MREFCEMAFSTSLGGTKIVRIDNPAAGLALSSVNAAAQNMMSANPFDETIGTLTMLTRADRVTITTTPLIAAS